MFFFSIKRLATEIQGNCGDSVGYYKGQCSLLGEGRRPVRLRKWTTYTAWVYFKTVRLRGCPRLYKQQ